MIVRPYLVLHKGEHLERGYEFWCPGCKGTHRFRTQAPATPQQNGKPWPIWSFNGDMAKPTFSPSLRYYTTPGHWAEPGEPGYSASANNAWVETGPERTLCHLFVQDGVINFCSDCPHDYNGKQGVAMVELPERRMR